FDVCRRKGKTRLPVDGRFPDDTGRHRAVSGGSAHEHPFDTVAGVDTQPQARDGRGPGGALAPVILPKPAHTAPGRASKNSPIRVGHGHRGRADTKRVRVTTKMRSGAASAVPYPVPPFFAKAIMHPQPSPHGMTHHPQQLSTPGAVWGMAAMLWCTAGILFTEFAVNMITAPLYGVELDYAFFYSLPRALVGVFVLVPAVPVTRGRPWARTMAKTVLIIQIVLQSMALLASNADMWTLFLFPMAIIGTVLLGRP